LPGDKSLSISAGQTRNEDEIIVPFLKFESHYLTRDGSIPLKMLLKESHPSQERVSGVETPGDMVNMERYGYLNMNSE